MKFKYLLTLLAGAAIFAAACVEDPIGDTESAIEITPSIYNVDENGGSQVIDVKADAPWVTENKADWITVSPASGNASAKVTVTVAKNDGEKARSAEVVFKSKDGDDAKIFTVKQDGGGIKYGTAENPYPASKAYEYVATLSDGVKTDDIYIKGVISAIDEKFGTKYGNATFYLTDDGKESDKAFQVYRALYIGNKKYDNEADLNISVGDNVVVCGKCVNYKGNTPETSQGEAYVVSIEAGTMPVITAAKTNVEIEASETAAELEIEVKNLTAKWTVATKETYAWVTDYTKEGTESGKIAVTVAANTAEDAREAIFVVSSEGASPVEITLKQKGNKFATTVAEVVAQITSADKNNPSSYSANITAAVVSYVNGGNAYIEDETGAILLYLAGHPLEAGDKVSGPVAGTGYLYNGLPEITSVGDGVKIEKGGTIPETEMTIEALLANYKANFSRRILLKGVKVTDAIADGDRNGKVAQGEKEIAVYAGLNNKGLVLEEGAEGNLICFPTIYAKGETETLQVSFWDNEHFSTTSEAPFTGNIGNAKQLLQWAALVNGGEATPDEVKLTADIDMNGVEWTPVKVLPEGKILDGQNHKIKNWTTRAGKGALVLRTSGTVKNIVLDESCKFTWTQGEGSGFVTDTVSTTGLVDNCVNYATAATYTEELTVSGCHFNYIAHQINGSVLNCSNYGDINIDVPSCTQNLWAAPIASFFNCSSIGEDAVAVGSCKNYGNVTVHIATAPKKSYVAGVVGGSTDSQAFANQTTKKGVVINCENHGAVTYKYDKSNNGTYFNVGGVTAYVEGKVFDCVNDGKVTAIVPMNDDPEPNTRPAVGGVCAFARWEIARCTNKGDIYVEGLYGAGGVTSAGCGMNANPSFAGVVGQVGPDKKSEDFTITDLHNEGAIKTKLSMRKTAGTNCFIGGCVGITYFPIDKCDNKGNLDITSMQRYTMVGGVAAKPFNDVTNCWNSGKIDFNLGSMEEIGDGTGGSTNQRSQAEYIGGVIGDHNQAGTKVSNCENKAGADITVVGGYTYSTANYYGGIIGRMNACAAELSNCTNYGNVTSVAVPRCVRLGGIVGMANANVVTNCHNHGDIKGVMAGSANASLGGLMGFQTCNSNGCVVSNCSTEGDVIATGSTIGGASLFIGGQGNTAQTWKGSTIKGNLTAPDEVKAGYVLGSFVLSGIEEGKLVAALTVGDSADPIKIKTESSFNGTAVSSADLAQNRLLGNIAGTMKSGAECNAAITYQSGNVILEGELPPTLQDFAKEFVKGLDVWQNTIGNVDADGARNQAVAGGWWENVHFIPIQGNTDSDYYNYGDNQYDPKWASKIWKLKVGKTEYSSSQAWEIAIRGLLNMCTSEGEAFLDGMTDRNKAYTLADGLALSAAPISEPSAANKWGKHPWYEYGDLVKDNGNDITEVGVNFMLKVGAWHVVRSFVAVGSNNPLGMIGNFQQFGTASSTLILDNYVGLISPMRELLVLMRIYKYLLDNNIDSNVYTAIKDQKFDFDLYGAPGTPTPRIKTADAFIAWAADASRNAILTADITLPETFVPDTLTATFDGQGHTITYNLTVASDATYNAGLFSVVDGTVKNLKVAGKINAGCANVGGIAAYTKAGATIENCESSMTIEGPYKASFRMGGIVGQAEADLTLKNCTNKGRVSNEVPEVGAGNNIQLGGVIGHIEGTAVVEGCVNDGEVAYVAAGATRSGGICGYINKVTNVSFINCTNNGHVYADGKAPGDKAGYEYLGGITGYYGTAQKESKTVYTNCVNNGLIESKALTNGSIAVQSRIGGIISHHGNSTATTTPINVEVKNCVNNGEIKGVSESNKNQLGGIIGYCEPTGNITCEGCTNNAPISLPATSKGMVGGIMGGTGTGTGVAMCGSTFTNVTITDKTVVTTGTGKAGLICGNSSPFTTALTGKVAAGKVVLGEVQTTATAENFQTLLLGNALGTGGSTEGVTFGE